MTAIPLSHRTTRLDKIAVRLGNALTEWGTRHERLVEAPSYAEQLRLVETSRDAAARRLPQLPR
ncbi:hypothetical protein ACFVWR_13960 [Leifsonia sp. NPDC058292]|uniref:hypothetical protein n=1 Tax=Leifsonia sp. NPDC058292 TaxID=3346428 RepID=UPI0036D9B62C